MIGLIYRIIRRLLNGSTLRGRTVCFYGVGLFNRESRVILTDIMYPQTTLIYEYLHQHPYMVNSGVYNTYLNRTVLF